jgi:hypothetical protein
VKPRGAWLALSLLAAPAAADVAVHLAPTTPGQAARVEVVARAAPLNEVLDRLARQIGMKVVYDGAQPRQLVTLSVSGRPPAETVLAVLEGQGLNFALLGDASGAGAQTLLVTGTAPATGASMPAARAFPGVTRRTGSPPPGSSPDAMEVDADDAEEEEQPFEPPANEVQQQPAAGQEAAPGVPVQPEAAPGGAPAPGARVPPAQPAGPTTSPFPVSPFAPQPTPYMPQPYPPVAPGGAPVGPNPGPQAPGQQQPPQPQPPQEQTPP